MERAGEATWLGADLTDRLIAAACLRPYQAQSMEACPVSSLVSSVRNSRGPAVGLVNRELRNVLDVVLDLGPVRRGVRIVSQVGACVMWSMSYPPSRRPCRRVL